MFEPTASQQLVRDHNGLALVVVAPAGCGKTEALALRIKGLLDRGDVSAPHRVLATTFSNRARDNLRQRLAAHLSPARLRDRVTVSNFHGLSARIVRAHASVLGLDPLMAIPDGDWVGARCRERSLGFQPSSEVQALLGRVKREAVDDDEVERRLIASGNIIALEIERERRASNQLTYDDLPRLAELLLAEPGVADLYRSHFGAVVVDEFQDLTPQQLRIVNSIGFGRTTYAGDLAQGIYGFAGARPTEIHAAIREECADSVAFAESHRSSPAVLAMVNALAPLTGGQELSCADPTSWPSGGLASTMRFGTTDDETAWLIDFATEVLEHAPNQRIAVIARTGPRRRFVDAAAAEANLPHFRWDDGVLDTDTARILRGALSRISISEFSQADDQLAYFRDLTGLAELQDPSGREALLNAIDWAVDLLRDGVSLGEVRSRIRVGDNETLLTKPGVHLLTGHAGKGQQFDWVFVVGAEEGTIPDFRAKTPAARDEEARVLSVMISRARHGVVVSCTDVVEAGTGRLQYKQPSPYFARLKTASPLNRDQTSEWLRGVNWAAVASR